jgi:hypothetical protein
MSDERHVLNQVTDYTLDLLPRLERIQVESHLASCLDCRQAFQREQRIGREVRLALQSAIQPDSGRLRSLMPPIASPYLSSPAVPWPKQLAMVSLLLTVLLGSLGLWRSSQNEPSMLASPTLMLATATANEAVTATLASAGTAQSTSARYGAAETNPTGTERAATPVPRMVPLDIPLSAPAGQ